MQKLDQGAKWHLVGSHLRAQAGDPLIDFPVDLSDRLIQAIPLTQVELEQEAVVVRQPPMQRIVELLRRRLDLLAGKIGQLARLAHPGDHRLDDPPSAGAHDIGDHRVEFDIGFRQRLLDPLHVPRLLAYQLLAGAGQRTQLLHLFGRDEARLDQPAGQKVGDPRRVVDVGLAPGDVLDVRRIGDDQFELPFAQDLEHRHPIDARRLHRHVRAPAFFQPRSQFRKRLRRGRKGPALPLRLAVRHNPHTSHHRVLVYIKACYSLIQDIHDLLLYSLRRRHRCLSEKNPRKRAPGQHCPFAPVWVIQATRVQLATGLSCTREKPTSLPTARQNTPSPFHRTVSSNAGRLLTAGANSQ